MRAPAELAGATCGWLSRPWQSALHLAHHAWRRPYCPGTMQVPAWAGVRRGKPCRRRGGLQAVLTPAGCYR